MLQLAKRGPDVPPYVIVRQALVAGAVDGAVALEQRRERLGGGDGLQVEGDGAEHVQIEGMGQEAPVDDRVDGRVGAVYVDGAA